MNATKAGGGKSHKVHIYNDRNGKPLCGATRSLSGWQQTMFLEPNCKSCIKKMKFRRNPLLCPHCGNSIA